MIMMTTCHSWQKICPQGAVAGSTARHAGVRAHPQTCSVCAAGLSLNTCELKFFRIQKLDSISSSTQCYIEIHCNNVGTITSIIVLIDVGLACQTS